MLACPAAKPHDLCASKATASALVAAKFGFAVGKMAKLVLAPTNTKYQQGLAQDTACDFCKQLQTHHKHSRVALSLEIQHSASILHQDDAGCVWSCLATCT